MNFKQNYFELFSLPIIFDLNKKQLNARFRQLQSRFHPDRYATASDQEKRLSLQATAQINQAHHTLINPRLRARYLLRLQSVDFDDEKSTSNDMTFLMQQMKLRENIESIEHSKTPFESVDQAKDALQTETTALEREFCQAYAQQNYQFAKDAVLKMRFFERMSHELEGIEERLEERFL